MNASASASSNDAFAQASLAAALFAIDPFLSGVSLRAAPGPARDSWLALLREYLPDGAPLRRAPLAIADDRLLGGLDLAATLRAGFPVGEVGLIAQSNGGVLLLAMAERLSCETAAHIVSVLDAGRIDVARDGYSASTEARIGVVALDEGQDTGERPPAALLDRLAFHLDLSNASVRDIARPQISLTEIEAARARFSAVVIPYDAISALVAVAAQFGVDSLRAPLLARRVARAACALRGACVVDESDLEIAARYVFAPRATCLPDPEDSPHPEEAPREQERDEDTPQNDNDGQDQPSLEDVIIAATRAALPADLLTRLETADLSRVRASRSGVSGATLVSARHGRPLSARRGALREGRLSLIDTLRAAAPWQKLRYAEMAKPPSVAIQVRADDFRITRFRERRGTAAIFVVDVSGSSAMQRLAEVKGAIELMLADCYVRRDSVALVAFRGKAAEIVLPPTRSLARAKRLLASMPGGGGTPLALALDAAAALADGVKRKGQTPLIILLTDGKANIDRAGAPDRARAFEDALQSARQVRSAGYKALAIDSAATRSSACEAPTRKIADAMQARYLRLPFLSAAHLSQAVRAATAGN